MIWFHQSLNICKSGNDHLSWFAVTTYITRFWLVPGVSQTLHCVIRSASFPFFAPVESRPLLFMDTFTRGTLTVGGGMGGGGNVISVLVEVATNICGLDSDAASPSGRGIGFICVNITQYHVRILTEIMT